ncbi:hypothetical protein ACVOMT_10850 [Sphingomonas panni]
MLILERNPIARGMMRTLFAAHVGDTIFVDDARALRDRFAVVGARAILVDMASLAAGSDDPVGDLSALAELAGQRTVPMVVMTRPGDQIRLAEQKVTTLQKPVSATQLIDALFVVSMEGALADSLVPDAA